MRENLAPTAVSHVDVLHSGKPVCQLAVTSGRVTVDADRPVRRKLVAELSL